MISSFQYITPSLELSELKEHLITVLKAGIDWVQLRQKEASDSEFLEMAKLAREITKGFEARLIINDRVSFVSSVGADGVHIGKNDMSPIEARKLLGDEVIIGGTANTLEDVTRLQENGVDYIGLGPFRFTETKKNLSPTLGLNGYRKLVNQVNPQVPVIAIGGIEEEDIKELIETGVYGIAVSGLVSNNLGKEGFVEELLNKMKVNG